MDGNLASERLLLRLGFKFEGVRRDSGYWKGQFHDLNCYGLLSHELVPSADSATDVAELLESVE